MPLHSDRLGLTGRADLVEFWPAGVGEDVRPVDYKRGRASRWENDHVQLCAQALCLEEMLGTTVSQGSIYHAGSRRRTPVAFDDELRSRTRAAISELRFLLESGEIPPPAYRPRCHGCSFEPECLPAQRDDAPGFARYMRQLFAPLEEA